MKIRLRPDPPGMREPNESEMNDWLANLREEEASEPGDTRSDAEGEFDGTSEAAAAAPETDGAIEASGVAEPLGAAGASGASEASGAAGASGASEASGAAGASGAGWGPADYTGNGDAHPLLGAPVSAVADPTDFVDADEPAEPYGVPRVTSEPAQPSTGVTDEAHGAGQRDVAAESTGEAWTSAAGEPWAPSTGARWAPVTSEDRSPAAEPAQAPATEETPAQAPAAAETRAHAAGGPWAPEAGAVAPAGRRRRLAPGGRRPQAPIETPVRALIGEEMRTPTVWCELEPGNCISWHADREALGMADVRARAIAAGWRIDALGRLTCPQCQQRSASFRTTQPVVLWSRAYALTMAARQAARQGGYQYPQPAFYPREA
jgi:hypothetical protein